MYLSACSYIEAPPPMLTSSESSPLAISIAASNEPAVTTPSCFHEGSCVTTILVRPGKGPPKYPNIDSNVFLPMMIGCPEVNRLKRFKSSGICHRSLPSFPSSRFFPIATTAVIIGFFMHRLYHAVLPQFVSPTHG